MVFKSDEASSGDSDLWSALQDDIKGELEIAQKEIQEITLLLEQSKLEVNKLANRNASVTARLQQVFSSFDSIPREDIRAAYDAALDTQQRLFVMRGQLEKLQSDQSHLERYYKHLKRVEEVKSDISPSKSVGVSKDSFGTVEAIIQAQEAERQRLSRQMHDGPAQALSNFILQTEIAMRLFDIDQEKARGELGDLKESATSTFQQVRDFIFELRPMMLDDLGLVPTLKRYVEAFIEQSEVDVNFSVTGVERRLESYIEVMIFRAIQELMGNAVRQGQASQVGVQMEIGDVNVSITVEDNGKGFDVDAALEGSGTGLKVIKERVEMLGGFMEMSSVVGQGSRMIFQIPAGVSGKSVFA
jgi:two-component system sensor histidine kinase DegS